MSRLEVIAVCLVFLLLLLKQKKVVDMWQCSDVILPGEGQTGAGSAVEPQHVMLLCGNTSVKCSLLHSYFITRSDANYFYLSKIHQKALTREAGMPQNLDYSLASCVFC